MRLAKVLSSTAVRYIYRLIPTVVQLPKISVVLVNKNGQEFLASSLQSIVDQDYPNLELIVVDGASTDNSLAIIDQFKDHIHTLISEPDKSQYHAVQKGFDRSSGTIMAWMNSDDRYLPGAFKTVAELFATFPDVRWLMGFPGEYTANDVLIQRISLSWARWSKWRYWTFDFQFIQQESCFWTRSLWEEAGSHLSQEYPLAGDLELWTRFFRFDRLHTTVAALAGFRQHSSDQRSVQFRNQYMQECVEVLRRERKGLPLKDRLALPFMRLAGLFLGPFFFFQVPFLRLFYGKLFGLPELITFDASTYSFIRGDNVAKMPPIYFGSKKYQSPPKQPE